MKEKTVCFTGHRRLPTDDAPLREALHRTLFRLVEEGFLYFAVGGALGFDTMAAQTVLSLRSRFPLIQLWLVLPCPAQDKYWSEEDRLCYEQIKAAADRVTYTSAAYHAGCMHKRNRCLVDQSSACVCYVTKSRGGSYYTAAYAKRRGIRVISVL